MARLNDGHSTTIGFADDSSVQLWEKEVQPPGISAGGANDTTTMQNTAWRTMAPKSLKSLTPFTLNVAYDTALYTEIVTMAGSNQLITITFPDGSTLAFWGWIDEFAPAALVEGAQPVADITIIPSNQNDSDVETAPVHTP